MPDSNTLKPEFISAMIDYLKHLTTLSTGSIVLIATFWEKLSANPVWKSAVAVSIGGFILSILSSATLHLIYVLFAVPGKEIPELAKDIGTFCFIFTWLGFLAGIVGLATFALKNISRKQGAN